MDITRNKQMPHDPYKLKTNEGIQLCEQTLKLEVNWGKLVNWSYLFHSRFSLY